MNIDSDIDISVIVPVYNHWHQIPALIECLGKQTIGTNRFELILVDNGSDSIPTNPDLPEFVKMSYCATPGSYAARNEGLEHARGEYLAFTDSDCRPVPDWLAHLLACMETHAGGGIIIAGAIEVVPDDPGAPNPYELYDMTLGLPQERYVRHGYGTTANLFLHNTVFDIAGRFDPGRFSGGDAEFCRRAGKHGIGIMYCEKAVIYHPARDSWADLAGKVRRIKGGQIKTGPYRSRLHYALRTFLPPARAWRMIMTSGKLKTSKQRLTVFAIQCRIWLVEITALIGLLLGKKPARS